MSQNLSALIQQPIAGLVVATPAVTYTASRPIWTWFASDTTAGAEAYPQLVLKTGRNVAGAGGSLTFQAQNATPAYLSVGAIQGAITVLTAGQECSVLNLSIYSNGAGQTLSLAGGAATTQLAPSASGIWTLGGTPTRFLGAYFGNAAATLQADLTMDATSSSALFGTPGAMPLAFKTNGNIRVTIAAAGTVGINAAPSGTAMVVLGGTQLQVGVATQGYVNNLTIPNTNTTSYAGFNSSPSTSAAAFTLATLQHYSVTDTSKGAGSVLTNQYGYAVPDMVAGANNYGFYSAMTAGAAKWALNMNGTAKSYFGGQVGIGDAAPTPQVSIINTGNAYPTALSVTAPTGNTSTLLLLNGFDNTNAYSALKITDNAANIKFVVRGDGAIGIGQNAVTGQNLSLTGASTFTANSANAPLSLVNNIAVAASALGYGINVSMTVPGTMGASSFVFGTYVVMAVTTSASSFAEGTDITIFDAGAGGSVGLNVALQAQTGHTGLLTGQQLTLATVATSAVGSHIFSLVASTVTGGGTAIQRAFNIAGLSGNDQITNIIWVDNSVLCNGSVLIYNERNAGTGAFLTQINPSAVTIFQVDVSGNIILGTGGTAQRFKADLSNATLGNRFLFTNAAASSASTLGVMPSTGGLIGGFTAYGNPDPTNSSYVSISSDGATINTIAANLTGTGGNYPLRFQAGSSGNGSLQVETNTDIRLGLLTGALATTATFGFPYFVTCAGQPTGAPTTRAGYAPFIVDTTTPKIWFYISGAWKGVAVA